MNGPQGNPTEEELTFYRVEPSVNDRLACECEQCMVWTITYKEGEEEIEIGQSWQGPEGKEAAEDICDLMNMAFNRGMEAV